MAPAAEDIEDEIRNEKNPPPLDEDDIALLKTYVLAITSSIAFFVNDIFYFLNYTYAAFRCFSCFLDFVCLEYFF